MPAGIVLLDEFAEPGITPQTGCPTNLSTCLSVKQDAEPQEQRAKLVAKQRMDLCISRGVLLHPGDRLADRMEVGRVQRQVIWQPVETGSWQEIGSRLRF